MTREELSAMFDHSLLTAYARDDMFYTLCEEAKSINCAMVAINSGPVRLCKEYLKDTNIHVGAAISFPLGQMTIDMKKEETLQAIHDGTDEIDYVLNVGKVKMHDYDYIEQEMKELVSLCRQHQVIIKVIFENCYLDKEEIKQLSLIAKKIKPDYIKTSTGFGPSGAKIEDVKLMKDTVGDDVLVKAAGGIRDLQTCMAMIEAGASRIGTSSSLKILEEYDNL